ncbi:MAG: hypothetical protein ABIG84_07365 [archaeon]
MYRILEKRHRKGQESMLNIMAIVIIVSVIFLYFFYVTQSQKVESSKIFADQQKYRYAEIVLMNMYYIKPAGSDDTITEVIGKSQQFGDKGRNYEYMAVSAKVNPKNVVKQYLDRTIADYNYYFFVEKEDIRSFEVNGPPPENIGIMAHAIVIPMPDSKENVVVYLYVW